MSCLYLGLVLTFWMQLAKAQEPVISVITNTPYHCKSALKLRCTPTSGCCGSTLKIWFKDGTQIINSGNPADSQKYEENDIGNSYFEMTIFKLAKSDFGSDYSCHYAGLTSSTVHLNTTDYICNEPDTDCKKCGLYCWLYNLIGVVLSVIIAVLIIFFCFDSLKECRTMVIISGTVVSFIVTAIVAPLIGVYSCPCKDGNEPACIPIGFISGIIFGIVILVNVNKGKDSTAEGSDNSTRSSCCPGSTVCPGPAPEETTNRRPHHVEKKAEKKERAQNVTHLKTEGSSKLDDVPRGRPLPQLKDISHIPASVPPQNNTIKLDPIDVSAEKKKKKKKKKKQADGEENVGFDE